MQRKAVAFGHQSIFQTERGVMRMLGINPKTVDYAIDRPYELGFQTPPEGEKNQNDALRHILLSAELHRLNPNVADTVLNAHEQLSGRLHGQDPRAREMDLFNNEIGKEIGKTATSRAEVEALALKALERAKTVKGLED
jgi:hypothetical protein